MKLISKIKKWFQRNPPSPPKPKPKLKQEGIYFSVDDLKEMMSTQIFREGAVLGEGAPLSSKAEQKVPAEHLGPIYNNLVHHIPSLKRMLRRVFMEREQDTALGYYSDAELKPLLIERGGTRHYRGPWAEGIRQAIPSVLITKQSDYKRKINGKYKVPDKRETDGKYPMQETIVPSVANGRVVRA